MEVLDGQLKELDRLRKEQEQVLRKINGMHSRLQQVGEESQKFSLNCATFSVCLKRSYFGCTETGEGPGFCVVIYFISGGLRGSKCNGK